MKQIKKRLLALAAAACLLAGTAFAAGIPAAPADSPVLDQANVLSAATEQAVTDLTVALDQACGAQIAVLTVDFTGTLAMEEYAYQVFQAWDIGDKKKNNGVLLLLVIGDENYYCVTGTGLERDLPPSKVEALLWDNLEEGFAAGDYDKGVTAFANALYGELCAIYNVQPSVGGQQPAGRRGFGLGAALLVLLAAAVLIFLVVVSSALHPVRYVRTRYFGYVYPPRPPRWWHRHYHRPPPGFGPGPRPPRTGGGFGGGPSRTPGSSGFKGFGGGSSRGSGAGRRGGSSGGSRPGGAGRRK